LGSIVEHLHPVWGKGATDDTYIRGQRYAERDQRTFRSRLEANQGKVAA